MTNRLIIFLLLLQAMALSACGKKIEDTKKEDKVSPGIDKPLSKEAEALKEQKKNLYNAILGQTPSVLRTELDSNKTIDYYFEDGNTPLTLALQDININTPSIIILIMDKAKKTMLAQMPNSQGDFPLYLAVSLNNQYILNILLKYAVNINQKHSNKTSSLIKVLENNNPNFANILLIHGADISDKNSDNLNVEQIAKKFNYTSTVELIKEIKKHKTIDYKNIYDAIKKGKTDFVNYLFTSFPAYEDFLIKHNFLNEVINLDEPQRAEILDIFLGLKKINLNIDDDKNVPPLIFAIANNELSIVNKLLANEANPLVTDKFNKPALIYAIEYRHESIASILFQKIEIVTKLDKEKFELIRNEACDSLSRARGTYVLSNLLGCF